MFEKPLYSTLYHSTLEVDWPPHEVESISLKQKETDEKFHQHDALSTDPLSSEHIWSTETNGDALVEEKIHETAILQLRNGDESLPVGKNWRYWKLDFLGAGKFGKVFKCQNNVTMEWTCVKLIAPSNHTTADEINALQKLNHPRILSFIEVVQMNDGVTAIITPFAEKGDLSSYLARTTDGKLPERTAKSLYFQIAEGIAYTHSMKIAHCDLTLSNILITGSNSIKIADWGMAKSIPVTVNPGCVEGTAAFMAPEVWLQESCQGNERDVWAMGIILYKMLFGKLPFEGASLYETRTSILNWRSTFPRIRNSLPLKNLFSRIIVNVDKRITAEEILTHSWVKKQCLASDSDTFYYPPTSKLRKSAYTSSTYTSKALLSPIFRSKRGMLVEHHQSNSSYVPTFPYQPKHSSAPLRISMFTPQLDAINE